MAATGSPLSNDELVDYIITGLSKEFNAITVTLTLGNKSVPYDEFYSHILSFEALQEQPDQPADWSSSANVVMRPGLYSNPGRPRAPEYPAGAPRQPGASMAAMAARMVARAMPPPMVVNPPVANPVVTRIMAGMVATTVVAIRTTAAANATPPVSNLQLLGACCVGLQEPVQPQVSAPQQQQPTHRECGVY
jgi:hypothetical protein